MIVGGYELHLYCDNEGMCRRDWDWWERNRKPGQEVKLFPDVFNDGSRGECMKIARTQGWKIEKNSEGVEKAYCPQCTGRGSK